ncbi:tyrosine-type recombinase/integrase [Aestuariivita boseongensis]|uniref:tyrosine-type recombinase/integrase n=1 Tax=Aestuariivita boseongensis TaxID=1470562 RepID=UPI00068147A9|nr:tyrosine-type recombinase/integrase [Aestuariivita boseongensis]
MPLKAKLRGHIWWASGRVHYNGKPITKYIRRSTGASEEAGAHDWIKDFEAREIRRYILGEEADKLILRDAITLYDAKPKEAKRLLGIFNAIGGEFLNREVDSITGKELRDLARILKPSASTDTMWREVVTPLRSVINSAHDLGKCQPIKVKRYSEKERIQQDESRGKQSRVERTPGNREWLEAFCAEADVHNAAMARFMFETAARIDQAVSLTPRDVDLMKRRVWLKAQKGHPAQWVSISHQMMIDLANLPPKRPINRKTGDVMKARIFGYGSPTGYTKRWRTICQRAGIPYIPAHQAGRHGYFTELTVRLGVNPVDAAKAGRWADPNLPMRTYAHSVVDEGEIRERLRTNPVQAGNQSSTNYLAKKEKM